MSIVASMRSEFMRAISSRCRVVTCFALAIAMLASLCQIAASAPPVNSVVIQFSDGSSQTINAPAALPSATEPAAVSIPMIIGKGDAPLVVHARLPDNPAMDTATEFDFGDGARFSKLPGFNAAHIYDTPGTYTLTVKRNSAAIAAIPITVRPDFRRRIYVAPNGDAAAPGMSQDAPTTLARAFVTLSNDSELLLKRGSTFIVGTTFNIKASNVLIGAYGDGDRPLMNLSTTFLDTDPTSNGVMVQDLVFDMPARAGDTNDDNMPAVLTPRGTNFAVRNCEFRNIGIALNSNAGPSGLLVQDNSAPLPTGLRGYLVWLQANDSVIIGNFAANSTRQHIVRGGGWQRTLIAYNDFANTASATDPNDIEKCTIALQADSARAYVARNLLHHGTLGVGPLVTQKGTVRHIILDSNVTDEAMIGVTPGASDVLAINNFVSHQMDTCFQLGAENDPDFNRQTEDVRLVSNTCLNPGERGNALRFGGRLLRLSVSKNLYVAPRLLTNTWGTTPVELLGKPELLGQITQFAGNIWPAQFKNPWAMDVPDPYKNLGSTDTFQNVQLDSAGNPPPDITAGARVTPGATTRPIVESR